MKIGDLVRHTWSSMGLGLIVGWYDSVNGYVIVRWLTAENPCHVSKLEVVSESR